MQPGRMTADEDLEKLVIKPLGAVQNLLDLQARLDIEIIADVTSLKVEIDDANPALARRLVGLELDGRLEHERRVADTPGARNKRNGDGLGATRVARMLCIFATAVAREDVNDFPWVGVDRDPVCIATTQKRLVVAGRKLLADQHEEYAAALARHSISHLRESGRILGGRYNQHKSWVIGGSTRNGV